MGRTHLSFGSVAVLHAIARGSRFGFDVMAATGLTSGTVYPALDRVETLGLVRSHWEDEASAHAEGRPARRYFRLTAAGATALQTALTRYKALEPIAVDPSALEPEGLA
ncbi:MAG TPA: helix-turn-helix transcriptional regulator [Vicinamibacterales bacterium]|nr:helix-turn-helix transcriptional regulator [Vicinamibacterales bacterium]